MLGEGTPTGSLEPEALRNLNLTSELVDGMLLHCTGRVTQSRQLKAKRKS